MSKLRYPIVDAAGLMPYIDGLRAVEADILYPIADGADSFAIDHGPAYHPFFTELGRQARFMVVLKDDRVVGGTAGVWRDATLGEHTLPTLYMGDLKLAREVRGKAVPARMYWRAMLALYTQRELRGWSLIWGAAMRGVRGDVTHTMRGAHPGRIALRLSSQQLYFVDPAQLAALDLSGQPCAPEGIALDLSPELAAPKTPPMISTRGKKDFRLTSSGQPWPLLHIALGPAQLAGGLGSALKRGAAMAAAHEPGAVCCFGLDDRLTDHIGWLAARGVHPGAVCNVIGFPIDTILPASIEAARWTHLCSAHI
jgi:hypothetical protein